MQENQSIISVGDFKIVVNKTTGNINVLVADGTDIPQQELSGRMLQALCMEFLQLQKHADAVHEYNKINFPVINSKQAYFMSHRQLHAC